MSQLVNVSEAQDQLLETAFELYRIIQRLHQHYEGLRVPFEIAMDYYQPEETADEPPTIELAVAEEIDIAVDQLLSIADQLQKTSRINDASIRAKWRSDRKKRPTP